MFERMYSYIQISTMFHLLSLAFPLLCTEHICQQKCSQHDDHNDGNESDSSLFAPSGQALVTHQFDSFSMARIPMTRNRSNNECVADDGSLTT